MIDRLSTGGRGVGRHEGMVIFVPDTAPGDRVRVEISLVKKNFVEAKLIRVLTPSPHRIPPACPIAGICGGCSWQHVAYDEQLTQKRELVADAFRKFARNHGPVEVAAPISSPKTFHYRNRIQLHYASGKIGFFERGSHRIVDIERCPITDERLNDEILPLKRRLNEKKSGPTRVQLYLTESGDVVSGDGIPDDEPLGFAQVNSAQNESLVQFVMSRLPERLETVFDLYAGAGNFSFPLAIRNENFSITAVELNARSVREGAARAARDGLNSRLRFVEARVERFLRDMRTGAAKGFDRTSMAESGVILDPPRTGCDPEAITMLNELAPKVIVYVSCHPVTLARDISALRPELFEIVEIAPFDMFPQTDHVETVTVIRRK